MSAKAKGFELLKRRLRHLGYKDNIDSYSSETIEALLGDLMRVSKAYQDCKRDPVAAYDFEETDAPGEERFKFKNLSRENEELNGHILALRQDQLHREAQLRRYKALAEGVGEDAKRARNLLEAENAHLRAENVELKRRLAQLLRGGAPSGREAENFRELLARLAPAPEEPPAARSADLVSDLTRQLRQTREEGAEKAQLVGLYSQEIDRLRAKVGYFEKLQRSLIAAEALALEQRQLLQAQAAREAHVEARAREGQPLSQLLRQIDADVLKIKSSLLQAQPAGCDSAAQRPPDALPGSKTHKSAFYRPQAAVEEAEARAGREKSLKKENGKLLDLVYKLCADKDKIIESLLSKNGAQPAALAPPVPTGRAEPARAAKPSSATTIAEALLEQRKEQPSLTTVKESQ